MTHTTQAYRASIIHSIADPAKVGQTASYEYWEDGLLIVKDGLITACGDASTLLKTLPADAQLTEYTNALITPGFIDTHIHYPQTGMIASYGEQLLDWLNNYTFPEEHKFSDKQHALEVAELFTQELLKNGTTTALVFGTVHPESVDALFEVAQSQNMRLIAGKVMMDRNAPDTLTDTAATSYEHSKQLIERWHNKGRLHYAVTPRFAPTSTPEQLSYAGQLLKEYPDVFLHTHLSENKQEIEWVKSLFPEQQGYLDVYDHFELLGQRSVFAHGVHLCDSECQRLSETGSSIAFCPTSNLFLGSGLFNLAQMEEHNVSVGLGTDIGAGTSFSMLQTLNEAYKVMQLQNQKLNPFKSLYLATLAGAQALKLEDKIGTLHAGTEADFVVLDYASTPLLKYRLAQAKNIEEKLFALMMLGDDRSIKNTYVMGKPIF
jgi:guanine deaminase